MENVDPLSEVRSLNVYVPRDETFLEIKQVNMLAKAVSWMLHCVVPTLEADTNLCSSHLSKTNNLSKHTWNLNTLLRRLVDFVAHKVVDVLPSPSQTFNGKNSIRSINIHKILSQNQLIMHV